MNNRNNKGSRNNNGVYRKLKALPTVMNRAPEEDADEIIPGVWIGRWQVSLNDLWLKKNNIQTVFNCTKNLPFHPGIPHQYRIPVDDNLQPAEIKNMETWSSEIAYKIFREYNAGHPMLVHCHAGMQRSTTAVAFFLMALTGRPLIQVMYMIQSKRQIAFRPSANFAPAMRAFESQSVQLRSKNPNSYRFISTTMES